MTRRRPPRQALHYSSGDLAFPSGDGPRAPPDSWSQLWVPRVRGPTAISLQLGLDDGAYTEIVKGDLQPGDDLIIGERGGILEKLTGRLPILAVKAKKLILA